MNCIICCHIYTENNKQKCNDEWFSPQGNTWKICTKCFNKMWVFNTREWKMLNERNINWEQVHIPRCNITRAGRLATKSTSTYNNLTNGEVNNGIWAKWYIAKRKNNSKANASKNFFFLLKNKLNKILIWVLFQFHLSFIW